MNDKTKDEEAFKTKSKWADIIYFGFLFMFGIGLMIYHCYPVISDDLRQRGSLGLGSWIGICCIFLAFFCYAAFFGINMRCNSSKKSDERRHTEVYNIIVQHSISGSVIKIKKQENKKRSDNRKQAISLEMDGSVTFVMPFPIDLYCSIEQKTRKDIEHTSGNGEHNPIEDSISNKTVIRDKEKCVQQWECNSGRYNHRLKVVWSNA